MTVEVLSKKNSKLNNRGASLVELLIMLAIIAVLISGSFAAIGLINSSSIKQATRTTKDYLEKTRTKAMSVEADEWNMILSNDDDSYNLTLNKVVSGKDEGGNTVTTTDVVDEKNLGSRVTAQLVTASDNKTIGDGDSLKVTFVPSSGAVEAVFYNGTKISSSDGIIVIEYTVGERKTLVKLYTVSGKIETE